MTYWRNPLKSKPHLYRVGRAWVCVARCCEAAGASPEAAFLAWRSVAIQNGYWFEASK